MEIFPELAQLITVGYPAGLLFEFAPCLVNGIDGQIERTAGELTHAQGGGEHLRDLRSDDDVRAFGVVQKRCVAVLGIGVEHILKGVYDA